MADALDAFEKLADAVDALEKGAGSVHERLFEAFTYLVRIGPEDISDEDLRHAFVEVRTALTSEHAQGRSKSRNLRDLSKEGRLVASLKAMDDEHAQDIARRIVDLYHALDRLLHG
jgi:hypothetical protein